MTTTEAIRRILHESSKPLSLLEIQRILFDRFGITAMDSVGRRIREMRIAENIQIHKREKAKHIWEYWIPRFLARPKNLCSKEREMSGRNRDNESEMISRKELRMLLFWAGWGIGHARGGSNIEYTEGMIWNLAKIHGMRMDKPIIGEFCRSKK